MTPSNQFFKTLSVCLCVALGTPAVAAPTAYETKIDTLVTSLTQLIRSDAAQNTGLAVDSETAARLRHEINDLMAEAKATGKSTTAVGRALTYVMMKRLGADFPPWLLTPNGRKDASILFMGRSAGSLLEQDRGRAMDHMDAILAEASATHIGKGHALVLAQNAPAPVNRVVTMTTTTTNSSKQPVFYVIKSGAPDPAPSKLEIRDAVDVSAPAKTVVVQPGQTLASIAIDFFFYV